MNIISRNQEKYYFLNMCILCRYARYSQAQSQIWLNNLYSYSYITLNEIVLNVLYMLA